MRKTSILILCIAVLSSLMLPVSARPKQSPSIVALEGAVSWTGGADVRDVKKSFQLRAYYPKEGESIEFCGAPETWPIPLEGVRDSPFALGLYIWKDGNGGLTEVKLTFSWGDTYVFKAYGVAWRTDATPVYMEFDTVERYRRGRGGSIILEESFDYPDVLKVTLSFDGGK